MCDFPDFTLKSALNDFAAWIGFNYFFYLMGAAAFLWFLQKYYRGLKAERNYFPSVYMRLLIEFILLNGTAMAAWIGHSCRDWDDGNGVVVHLMYSFWLLSFALQLASLWRPKLVWVSAFITTLSAVLALINLILCAVFVANGWSLGIYVATFLYLAYMAANLIVATMWPGKGSRSISKTIRLYSDAWDECVKSRTESCADTIRKTSGQDAAGPEKRLSDEDLPDSEEESGVSDNENGIVGPGRPPSSLEDTNRTPTKSRFGMGRRQVTVLSPDSFQLPQ